MDLLTGRYAATAYDDRSRAEWPPHPARFYSALVAALHDREPVDPEERSALLWLEQQGAPALDLADEDIDDVGRRDVPDVYVPVNDTSLVGDVEAALRDAHATLARLGSAPTTKDAERDLKTARRNVEKEEKKLAMVIAAQQIVDDTPSDKAVATAGSLLPERRTRQVRTFPVAIPSRSTFAFVWADAVPESLRPALERLCSRLTRLGHSSSLVHCRVVQGDVKRALVPDEDGASVLRTVGAGQLARLEAEFDHHQGVESRVLPAQSQRYGRADGSRKTKSSSESVFGADWILFERTGGARPVSSRGPEIARALRSALIETHGAETLPAALSGHAGNGSATDRPHVAFVALPWLAHEHADASIQGCAIVLPRALSVLDRRAIFKLVARWERDRPIDNARTLSLAQGGMRPVEIRRVDVADKWSLTPSTWCRPSTRFITATPIALDRNPGNLRSNLEHTAHRAAAEAQRSIAEACVRIGLPSPCSVEISLAPMLAGAQPVHAFLPWPSNPGRVRRVRVHADLRFDQPVCGPVILGAGRYFGLGLCLPVSENQS
ncbi:MAG: type I-U CRISPR-associated protein Csb2 [Myxococcota bacterium]|nr:type I-U CRISPR-associated protein Csb2 [Myxococcota bacterium]